MKSLYIIIIFILGFLPLGYGQDAAIHGRVFSKETGKPLRGATIISMKSKNRTMTKTDGTFSLKMKSLPDTLLLSNVGYKDTYLPVQKFENEILVFMEQSNALLDEVVVNTGYQQLKPNEVTGSIQVLDNKELQQRVGTNILDRLNHLAVGIRFDNEPFLKNAGHKLNFSVRGLSTINGPLDPLIILDGFIYEGDIENIDPNSIDNVTILKDAAATSIWGARAGNGVVVLTTKKADMNQGVRVSFNTTTIMKQIPDLKEVYQMPATDYIEMEEMLFQKQYYNAQINYTPYAALSSAVEIFLQRKNGEISAIDSAKGINRLSSIDGREEYTKLFYTHPLTSQNSLYIRGGSAINTFNLGLGYTTDKNENSAYGKKLNIQLGNSFNPVKNLQIDLNVYYTNSGYRSGSPSYSTFKNGRNVPYLEFADEKGNSIPLPLGYRKSFTDSQPEYYLDWNYYPLEDYKHSISNNNSNELFSSVNTKYRLNQSVDFNIGYQYQQQDVNSFDLDDQDSYQARIMINQFTIYDLNTGNITYNVPLGGIRKVDNSKSSSYTFRTQANLRHKWMNHSLTGILGAEIRENMVEGNQFTSYGYSNDPLSSTGVSYITSYPILPENRSNTIVGSPSFSKTTNRFVSAYTSLAYLFKQRYGFSASIRNDGGNIFGATTNDKWKPLWSIGSSWSINDEPFYNLDFMSSLKIRTTYGFSGNVDLRKTPLPVGSHSTGKYTNYPAITISSLNDPSLRWEKVGTFNIGLDFSIFNKRIDGVIDYYIKNGTDLYGNAEYDYTVWGKSNTITKNTASMRGKGLEIRLNTENIQGNFKWNTRYLFSTNKSKTVDYYLPFSTGAFAFLTSSSITPVPGMPLNALTAYRWGGLDNFGNPQGYLDGELSTNYAAIRAEAREALGEGSNIVYIGSSKPEFFGSLINSFTYNKFSLSLNLSYKAGYYFKNNASSYYELYSGREVYPDIDTRWRQPGDEKITNMPSMQYPNNDSRDSFYPNADIHILKGDHIRLEYINIIWSPNANFKKKSMPIEMYLNISNLGIVWRSNKKNVDPEFKNRLSPLTTLALGLRIGL